MYGCPERINALQGKHQQTEKTQQKHTNPSVIPKVWAGAPDEP